jgi:ankyrin repeat protein
MSSDYQDFVNHRWALTLRSSSAPTKTTVKRKGEKQNSKTKCVGTSTLQDPKNISKRVGEICRKRVSLPKKIEALNIEFKKDLIEVSSNRAYSPKTTCSTRTPETTMTASSNEKKKSKEIKKSKPLKKDTTKSQRSHKALVSEIREDSISPIVTSREDSNSISGTISDLSDDLVYSESSSVTQPEVKSFFSRPKVEQDAMHFQIKEFIKNGNLKEVFELFQNGYPVEGVGHRGMSPLHLAIYYGQVAFLPSLIEVYGANPEKACSFGFPPLHYAVLTKRKTAVVELVSKYKVDTTALSEDGRTIFEIAKQESHGNSYLVFLQNMCAK